MPTATPAQRAGSAASPAALAEQLYGSHRARLLAVAQRNCGSPDDAEEALQDAFRRCITLPSLFLSLIEQSSHGA